MIAETDPAVDAEQLSQPLPARIQIALGGGIAVGAVALSWHAFTQRVPDGLISDRLGLVTSSLLCSLAGVAVAATVVLAIGAAALAGRVVTGKAAWTLAALTAVTAWAYLASAPRDRAVLISGPGGHPAISLAQASWLLLTFSAVLMLAGAIAAADGAGRSPRWPTMLPFVAVGVVAALTTGLILVSVSFRSVALTTAPPIAVPPIPTTLGTEVGYSVTTKQTDWLVPAGPGFVLNSEDALAAYDGATGAQRWRFPFDAFPQRCEAASLRSTGTADDAVVILECRRRSAHYENNRGPFLVSLDAMTGRLLWTMNLGWYLVGLKQLSPDAVPVRRGDDIASLDPRTGALRWTRTLSAEEQCEGYGDLVTGTAHSIVVPATCNDTGALRILDGLSGQERSVDLTAAPGALPAHGTEYDLLAAYADTVVIRSSDHSTARGPLLSIETRSGTMEIIPDPAYLPSVESVRTGQYPGPVLQLDKSVDPERPSRFYLLDERRLITANGVEVHNDSIPTGWQWAAVGDRLVTATGLLVSARNRVLQSVAWDGTTSHGPSPCGDDAGGLMTVPGAVLLMCQRRTESGSAISGYDILGLR